MSAIYPIGKPQNQVKSIVAAAILISWVIATIYGFWWFQFKDLRTFSLDTRNLQRVSAELAAGLNQLLAQNDPGSGQGEQITFINFWDPDCPCNRFSEAHIRDLVANYQGKNVHTVTVAANSAKSRQASLQQLAGLLYGTDLITADNRQLFGDKLLPYTPFAAVLSGNGDIQYIGPYSSGPACGRKGGAFVEKTLDALLAGEQPQGLQQNVSGCFCDFRAPKTINS